MSGKAPESGDNEPGAVPPPAGGSTPPSHGVHIGFKLLEQLKRRNVGRVAILYVAVCYLILEPFGTFVHLLALPEWIGRTVVLLMALGFPAALIFAWVFEITPGGLKPTAEVDSRQSIRRLTGRRLDVAIIVVLAVALAYFAADKFWLSKHAKTEQTAAPIASSSAAATPAGPVISEKSIAVLPFTDMSEKKDQEYFGDGMAEEILDLLAKIPGMTVIGRTSSFQFKGKNADLRTIGTELNAAHVLEGSVRNSSDQVRITAQLISTKTGAHEWSETYDRPIGDVLKLQDAIAAAVVRELQLTVTPGYLNSRSTVKNAEAYDLLLRGRHASDRWDKEGLDEAVTLFEQALARDPTSADVSAQLALVYDKQGEAGWVEQSGAFEQARRAALTAIKLDPGIALPHYVLGKIHIVYDWDWDGAAQEFRQAANLAPGNGEVRYNQALLSLALGRLDDALAQVNSALAQDPLDPRSFWDLGEIQFSRGQRPEAEAAWRRALDIRPTYPWAHYSLGFAMLARGDHNGALLEMQREVTEYGRQMGLAMTFHALGRESDANTVLARMLKDQAKGNAFGIAEVYSFLGRPNEAMLWLERAFAQRDPFLIYVKAELSQTSLAKDPRFEALLRKMNLPE